MKILMGVVVLALCVGMGACALRRANTAIYFGPPVCIGPNLQGGYCGNPPAAVRRSHKR